MPHTCAGESLDLPGKHPEGFLRLPATVRRLIYKHAGLITNSVILLEAGQVNDEIPEEDYNFTFNILQTCRAIYSEVKALLCSENTIAVSRYSSDYGFQFLNRLSPDACGELTDVFVTLFEDFHYCRFGKRPPETLTWDVVEMWQKAASHILSHASPRRLTIHLMCDTGVSEKTRAVLLPLFNAPGVLKDLGLRLARRFDQPCMGMIREARLRIIGLGPDPPSSPFRFFDLPPEIRRRIFEFTNLATPHRQVQWNPRRKFEVNISRCRCDGSACNDLDEPSSRTLFRCNAKSLLTGSYCSRKYSVYSPRCLYYKFSPISILLVSRAMFEEATAFFYSRNRTVVLPVERLSDTNPDPFRHDALKLFLTKHIRPHILSHLQTLEIVLPGIDKDSSPSETNPGYHDWCLAINHLAAHANVPNLTLIIHLWTLRACEYHYQFINEPYFIRRITSDKEEEFVQRIHEIQTNLLAPLNALRHMRRLFIHLEWPRHWGPLKLRHDISRRPDAALPGHEIDPRFVPPADARIAEREASLEKMVMGDEYDSSLLGKADQLPSQCFQTAWTSI